MLAIELATDAIHDHYRVRMPARSMPNTRGSTAALTACLQEQCECQEPESIGRSSGTSIDIQVVAAHDLAVVGMVDLRLNRARPVGVGTVDIASNTRPRNTSPNKIRSNPLADPGSTLDLRSIR